MALRFGGGFLLLFLLPILLECNTNYLKLVLIYFKLFSVSEIFKFLSMKNLWIHVLKKGPSQFQRGAPTSKSLVLFKFTVFDSFITITYWWKRKEILKLVALIPPSHKHAFGHSIVRTAVNPEGHSLVHSPYSFMRKQLHIVQNFISF